MGPVPWSRQDSQTPGCYQESRAEQCSADLLETMAPCAAGPSCRQEVRVTEASSHGATSLSPHLISLQAPGPSAGSGTTKHQILLTSSPICGRTREC